MPDGPDPRPLIAFDNSYARLPDRFFARLDPTPVKAPALIRLNEDLARLMGLDPAALSAPDGVEVLAGNRRAEGSEPLAMAYAGHQFGGWVPQLGDGRAILLGEVRGTDGIRRDIQLKGAGRTPFSRMGDGRAWLGPVLREYLVSEAMAAMGIPTTRALAAVATGETVWREAPLPGAILTRVARGHVRVGTFQYFVARDDTEALHALVDYVVARHYPDAAEAEVPALALLRRVVAAQADLVAQWMGVGFIHGVMNTDNMSIAGETIDYGPCAFMDSYHPETVFSSIDQFGRYAYRNQPTIAHWNLAQFASSLLPLIDPDRDRGIAVATDAIQEFPPIFQRAWLRVFAAKVGLADPGEADLPLLQDLLDRMAEAEADFTLAFRALSRLARGGTVPEGIAARTAPLDAWLDGWRARIGDPDAAEERMRAANPEVIPRNHRVEAAIAAATGGDHAVFEALLAAVTDPYRPRADDDPYLAPPTPSEAVTQTFCGT